MHGKNMLAWLLGLGHNKSHVQIILKIPALIQQTILHTCQSKEEGKDQEFTSAYFTLVSFKHIHAHVHLIKTACIANM